MAQYSGWDITPNNERDAWLTSQGRRRRSPVGPFKLEFDLLLVPLSFVLDVKLGTSGHVDPFSGHLYLESLARFEGVGQPAQLRYELGRGVDPLDVPVLLFAHRFSLGSVNDQPLGLPSYPYSRTKAVSNRPQPRLGARPSIHRRLPRKTGRKGFTRPRAVPEASILLAQQPNGALRPVLPTRRVPNMGLSGLSGRSLPESRLSLSRLVGAFLEVDVPV